MTILRDERIGGQRLILGDCLEVMPTLGRFDAVVTDPPYGMAFRSNYRNEKHQVITNDDGVGFLQWACTIPADHSRYVWMRWDNLLDVPKPRSLVTWVKNNWSMGDLDHEHARQTEVCAFYPGADHRWAKGRPSDVLHCPRTVNEHHPTEKPIALMQAVIEWTRGSVIDPFMGSGTTLVACQRLGRNGTGIEIDPLHFETACRRVEDAARQPDLFIAPAAQPQEEALDV